MKRIFIAVRIDPDDELLRITSSVKRLLGKEGIKWVDPSNLHLTLAFLGDTEEKKIIILREIMKKKCSGSGEMDFELYGMGLFKNLHDPRIIWIGIKSGERLISLYNNINEGLKSHDFKTEDRPFSPHLTLGRIKYIVDTENLKSVLEKYKDQRIQRVHISEVILYESILMQSGPLYKPIDRYPLKA